MPLAALAPIEARPFLRHAAIALVLITALTAAYSWIVLLPMALVFSVPALGLLALIVIPAGAALLGILELAMLLRMVASRLLSLRLPVALTAVVFLLVICDLRMMPHAAGMGWRILYGNIWVTIGFLGALAIMKPVGKLDEDKAALGFVILATLIGIDYCVALIWPMVLPGASYIGAPETVPWMLRALVSTGVPGSLRIPASAFLGLLLLGLGYAQSRTAPDAPLRDFALVPIGWQALIAIVAGFGLCAALYAFGTTQFASESIMRWVIALAISGWLYAVPLFFLLGLATSRGSKTAWAAFALVSFLPLATWLGQRVLGDWRTAEAAVVNARPLAWTDVPIQGRPLMVTWTNKDLDEKARQRGFAETFGFRSRGGRSWYAREGANRTTIEYEGPDDFVEIALGAHRPGKRFAGEGWHPRRPTTIHVYDVRDGKRTLVGTRIAELYEVPAFPPQLQTDGAWAPDRSRTRTPQEEFMIMRIVNELPPR